MYHEKHVVQLTKSFIWGCGCVCVRLKLLYGVTLYIISMVRDWGAVTKLGTYQSTFRRFDVQ